LLEVVAQLFLAIDSQRPKRAAAVMVHVDVQRHEQRETRLPRPHAKVIIVEEAHAVAFIKAADFVEDFAAHKQAEARQPAWLLSLAGIIMPPPGREVIQAADFAIIDRNALRRRTRVRHWPHQSDLRPLEQAAGDETVKP